MRLKSGCCLLLLFLLCSCSDSAIGSDANSEDIVPPTVPQENLTPFATATPKSCSVQAARYNDELEILSRNIILTLSEANQSTQASFAQSIADMREIRNQASAMDVPQCTSHVHELIMDSIDNLIDSLTSHLARDYHLRDAYEEVAFIQYDYALDAMEALDSKDPKPPILVDYVVTSDFYVPWLEYLNESGEEIRVKPELPWIYHFEAKPREHLSVRSEIPGACAILINGEVIAFSYGSLPIFCNGFARTH